MKLLSNEAESARKIINSYTALMDRYEKEGNAEKSRYYREKRQGAYELYYFILSGETLDLPIEQAHKIEVLISTI